MLTGVYGLEPVAPDEHIAAYRDAAARLRPYLHDTTELVHRLLDSGRRLLCEGAQGTLLDIDHGHYPYLTSSSATVGGALTGLGFGPQAVDRVVGVAAYCTRVGNGLPDRAARRDRRAARRLAASTATTGRPRRRLADAALRYAVRVNGMTELVLTKLDAEGWTLHIATAYEGRGPADGLRWTRKRLSGCALYETLPGRRPGRRAASRTCPPKRSATSSGSRRWLGCP